MKTITTALLIGASAMAQAADFRLKAPWGEHMVIQAGRPSTPSGVAPAGQDVAVTFNNKTYKTRADKQGNWQVTLPAVEPGGPHALSFASGDKKFEFTDVLSGDVWLCSGQSNMEWKLEQDKNAAESISKAKDSQIRLMVVPRDLGPANGGEFEAEWKVCDPASVAGFSAVGYYFGQELRKHRDQPLGLINSSWGGTTIEAWIQNETAKKEPDLKVIYDRWEKRPEDEKQAMSLGRPFKFEYKNLVLIDSKGKETPVTFTQLRADGPEGVKSTFKEGLYEGMMPAGAWATAAGVLDNGKDVDLSGYESLRIEVRGKSLFDIALSQKRCKDGDNFAGPEIKATDQWQTVEFKLAETKQDGWGIEQKLDLTKIDSIFFRHTPPWMAPEKPGVLFDSMIRPWTPFEIKGALWYQGESNLGRHQEYAVLLPTLFKGLKAQFNNPDLGLMVVQLPDFGAPQANSNGGSWAPMRKVQESMLAEKNTGLAVTLGLGEGEDWHPRDKKPVGRRLAWEALRSLYGKKGFRGHGPRFKSAKASGKGHTLEFETGGRKLKVDGKSLKGFEIKKGGVWEAAAAELKGGKVWVQTGGADAVRYAWNDNPTATLKDSEGLPALGFEADLSAK